MQLSAAGLFVNITRYRRVVIGRRALLLGGAALFTGAGLAGCTLGESSIRLPWNPPSPLPLEAAPKLRTQLAAATALAQLLLDHAKPWKLSARQVATLEWFSTALDEQAQVLLSSDPARRQRVTAELPPVPKPTQKSANAAWTALTSLLRTMRVEHSARALPATGPAALLWASLAGFCGTMALRLPGGLAHRGDDGVERTPDLTATGRDQVLALCLQAIYSYELALAATGLSTAQRARLQSRLVGWRTFRDQVLALAHDATASPPPLGYNARPATDATEAFELAATAETAALPILGAWLAGTASTDERRLGTGQLAVANTACVDAGGVALRWPGWLA